MIKLDINLIIDIADIIDIAFNQMSAIDATIY